jgi:L-cysteine S-thiosulfotransferase
MLSVRGGRSIRTVCLVLAVLVSGCDSNDHSARGFVLPRGDIEQGKTAFVDLGCNQCHSVAEVDLPAYSSPMRFNIKLGGEVINVRRYGDLLNSIVNPNHEIARQYTQSLPASADAPQASPMPDFTGVMTVAQLINLVEFLHTQYRETLPEYAGIIYGP